MAMDNVVVQPVEPVLVTEPVLPVAVEPVKPAEPQVLTEERVQQMIAEATTLAVEQAKQLGRKELQSEQDRNKAEIARAERRARFAESTMATTRQHLQTLDPDTAKEMELAEYRAKEQNRQAMEQEEQTAQYQARVVQGFQEDMTQFIIGQGIDPNDQRLDWAGDAPDLLTRMRRIHSSVTKVKKESDKASEARLDTKITEAEKRIKKELGQEDVNSVQTTTSGGVVSQDDKSFLQKWGSGELPSTKENLARAKKLES